MALESPDEKLVWRKSPIRFLALDDDGEVSEEFGKELLNPLLDFRA